MNASFESSTGNAPFNPRRFQSTAEHYVRGRLSYPDDLIRRVLELTETRSTDRVLDLGCGPGFLAVGFAPYVQEAVGIDPEPDMIAAAREYAVEMSPSYTPTFLLGSSYTLSSELGRFRIAAMGRSFHWMDRVATLRSLDEMIVPGGAVALFADRYLDVPENAWRKRFEEILQPFKDSDPDRGEGEGPWTSRHEPVLLKSVFSRLQRISVIRRLQTPVGRLLDRALSLSVSSPAKLGSRKNEFLEQITRSLEANTTHGTVSELVEIYALLAFRNNR